MLPTKRQAWFLLGLVALDAGLKFAAFRVLSPWQPIDECLVCIVLRVNSRSLGSAGQSIVASHGLQSLVTTAIFSIVLATLLLTTAARRRLTKRSIALSVLGALLVGFAVTAMFPSIGRLPYALIATTSRAAETYFWLVVWVLSPSKLWKSGALLSQQRASPISHCYLSAIRNR